MKYRLILSRGGRRPSWLKSDDILDNCFIIQQIVHGNFLTAKKTVVMQRFARRQEDIFTFLKIEIALADSK